MSESEFDLKELSELANVTPRTVHFYVQQGLLPPAGAPGPGARYGEGHILRLKLIRLLQKQHLPLAEIGKRLKGLSDRQVDGLIRETRAHREAERGSALDYIRGVLKEKPSPVALPSVAARASGPSSALHHLAIEAPAPTSEHRSQWERFSLTDGIELNVRRPLAREQQRQLEKILAATRSILSADD